MDGLEWMDYTLEELEFYGFYDDDYPREPPHPNISREYAAERILLENIFQDNLYLDRLFPDNNGLADDSKDNPMDGPTEIYHPPIAVSAKRRNWTSHAFEIHLPGYHHDIPVGSVLQYGVEILNKVGTSGFDPKIVEIGNTPRTDVYLWIDVHTESTDREIGAMTASWRLSAMIDMTREGLGWFPGLPWLNEHFKVQIYDPYWPRPRGADGRLVNG